MFHVRLRRDALALALVLPAFVLPAAAQDAPKPAPEMQAVLDKLKDLGAKPVSTLEVPQARMQASAADAAIGVQRDRRIPPGPEAKLTTRDIAIPTPGGNLPARVYLPTKAGGGPLPVIVYYHGGGWVIADINTYDASARGLAEGAGAIVVSVDYRHAPEHKFPAQHEDAYNAYVWVVENAGSLNGDSSRIAVAGESAGGNLAADVALMAKERKATLPVHQLLVYPIAAKSEETPSKKEFADAVPLSTKDVGWFVSHVFSSKDEAGDPRIDLVNRTDLSGLPPATVIAAEIDPLRSETEMYADKLRAAGVSVNARTFPGVTHEFFGMAKVVPQAKEAMDLATADLKKAFEAAAR